MPGNQYSDRTLGNDLNANVEQIAPDDGAVYPGPVRVICYDGTVVRVTTTGGQTIDHPVIPGLIVPVLVVKVHASGTDATQIYGYW